MNRNEPVSIVIVGASGDLARRKIYPALFALYGQGYLPRSFNIIGFARSTYSTDTFREHIMEHLTCRYVPGESCQEKMTEFLACCHYVSGQYDSVDAMLDLYQMLQQVEGDQPANRMFYLAVPPSVFLGIAKAIGDAGLVNCSRRHPWSRVVIEKPFGHDRISSDRLVRELANVFVEEQTYRIDHYLGKEVVQNLMVLRFANLIFEPIWNRNYIKHVKITWQEELDVQGRGGYFDRYGILRDVMQNHLLQILAIVAMECPLSLAAGNVRDEKVKALRGLQPVTMDRLVTGQYGKAPAGVPPHVAYREEEKVPPDSRCATFAACVLELANPRWAGVPFWMCAGKGLDSRLAEIRVQFRNVPANIFTKAGKPVGRNELVIRVQPDEAIRYQINTKIPGLAVELDTKQLDLRYKAAFDRMIPDAYEQLLLEVLRGDKTLFIREDELAAAWDVFTPVLHALDQQHIEPEIYPFGSHGPAGAVRLAQRFGVENE